MVEQTNSRSGEPDPRPGNQPTPQEPGPPPEPGQTAEARADDGEAPEAPGTGEPTLPAEGTGNGHEEEATPPIVEGEGGEGRGGWWRNFLNRLHRDPGASQEDKERGQAALPRFEALDQAVNARLEASHPGLGQHLARYLGGQRFLMEAGGCALAAASLATTIAGGPGANLLLRIARPVFGIWNYSNIAAKLGIEPKISTILQESKTFLAKQYDDLTDEDRERIKELIAQQIALYQQGVDLERQNKRLEAVQARLAGQSRWERLTNWLKTPEARSQLSALGWYASPVIAALLVPAASFIGAGGVAAGAALAAKGLFLGTTATSILARAGRARQEWVDRRAGRVSATHLDTPLGQLVSWYNFDVLEPLGEDEKQETIAALMSRADEAAKELTRRRIAYGAVGGGAAGLFYGLTGYFGEVLRGGPTPEAEEPRGKPAVDPYGRHHSGVTAGKGENPDVGPDTTTPGQGKAAVVPDTLSVRPQAEIIHDPALSRQPFGTVFEKGDQKFALINLNHDGKKNTIELCQVIEREGKSYLQIKAADLSGDGIPEVLKGQAIEVAVTVDRAGKVEGLEDKFGFIVATDRSLDEAHRYVTAIGEDNSPAYGDKAHGQLFYFARKEDVVHQLIGEERWQKLAGGKLGDELGRADWNDTVARRGAMVSLDNDLIPETQASRLADSQGDRLVGSVNGVELEFAPTDAPLTGEEVGGLAGGDAVLAERIKESAFIFPTGSLQLETIHLQGGAAGLEKTLVSLENYGRGELSERLAQVLGESEEKARLVELLTPKIFEGRLDRDELFAALGMPGTERPSFLDNPSTPLSSGLIASDVGKLVSHHQATNSPWAISLRLLKQTLSQYHEKLTDLRLYTNVEGNRDVVAFNLGDKITKCYVVPPHSFTPTVTGL